MGTTSSARIFLTILKCLVIFYSTYYVIGSICFASFRMTKSQFDDLLHLVKDDIVKEDTRFRESISARERLSVCLRLQNFNGKIPFDFQNWINLDECCGNFTDEEIVNTLSMEITFVMSGLFFGSLTVHRLWDYAITVSFIHIALSCLVMLSFPLNWSWWVCLGLAILQMIAFGEAVTFVRRKKQRGKVSPAIELKEPYNYLYKKM